MLCLLPSQQLWGKSFEISQAFPLVTQISLSCCYLPNSVYCPFYINHISNLINVCGLSHSLAFNYIRYYMIKLSSCSTFDDWLRALGTQTKTRLGHFRDTYIDTHMHALIHMEFIHMHMCMYAHRYIDTHTHIDMHNINYRLLTYVMHTCIYYKHT